MSITRFSLRTHDLSCCETREYMTTPFTSWAWVRIALICSFVLIKGNFLKTGTSSLNWTRTALITISAVAPVESETINMCIFFLGRLIGSGFTKLLFLFQDATPVLHSESRQTAAQNPRFAGRQAITTLLNSKDIIFNSIIKAIPERRIR